MKLVIEMPNFIYKQILKKHVSKATIAQIFKNGTPLPKGHGDLKDVSKIDYQQGVFLSREGEPLPIIHKIATIEMIRDWLPTIIEADKEG